MSEADATALPQETISINLPRVPEEVTAILAEPRKRGRPSGNAAEMDKGDPHREREKDKGIDYKEVENFGRCHLSIPTMARLLKRSVAVIEKLMARETSKFSRSYYLGVAKTEYDLSLTSLLVAVGKKKDKLSSPATLSQLCGQWLGWKQNGKKENTADAAEKVMRNVSKEQKAEMFNALMGQSPSEQEETIDDGTSKL